MSAATIKLYLPWGDPKRLRTAGISNWNGKAIAAPRTEIDALLERDELKQPGVYILTGVDPESGKPTAYIGEAEIIRDRLRQHRDKDFWVQAIVFASEGDNLTKAHVRYLEGQLVETASRVGRASIRNAQASGSKLPESDRADMEVFLAKIAQLLPVLGSDILIPILHFPEGSPASSETLRCKIKDLVATGRRTPDGFVVFAGSQASSSERPSAQKRHPYVVTLRQRLLAEGSLVPEGGFLRFTKDVEFSSPSAAASVVHGGGANGLIAWKREW